MTDTRSSTTDPSRTTDHLTPLGDLHDFEVADGYPDPRGWDVVGADDRKLGTVHELIVDPGLMRTRYLDVRLDGALIGNRDERDVLIPVGAARLDDRDDRVRLDSIAADQLAALPPYTHQPLTREYEHSLLAAFPAGRAAGATAGTVPAPERARTEDFYAHDHFDDRRFFGRDGAQANQDTQRVTRAEEELRVGKRAVPVGEVNVTKHVETEHVRTPVTVRREEVTIQRRPVAADANAGHARIGAAGENELRIPVTEEELVVEKRPVVKEEIIVSKQAVEETRQVEADLQRERVDIEKQGRVSGSQQGESNRPDEPRSLL